MNFFLIFSYWVNCLRKLWSGERRRGNREESNWNWNCIWVIAYTLHELNMWLTTYPFSLWIMNFEIFTEQIFHCYLLLLRLTIIFNCKTFRKQYMYITIMANWQCISKRRQLWLLRLNGLTSRNMHKKNILNIFPIVNAGPVAWHPFSGCD